MSISQNSIHPGHPNSVFTVVKRKGGVKLPKKKSTRPAQPHNHTTSTTTQPRMTSLSHGFNGTVEIDRLSGGDIALKLNGRYCADEFHHDKINCDRTQVQGWEKFGVQHGRRERVALTGGHGGKFCQRKDDGGLVCNSDGAREIFTLKNECDRNVNFVNNRLYEQVHIGNNLNEHETFQRCSSHFNRHGRDFFYQQHTNGHTICGFFNDPVTDDDDKVKHGHTFGAVCRLGSVIV